MSTINGLGYDNLVDYILKKSTLKKNQFTFAMEGGDGYASFLVAKGNELLCLGKFSYDRFIRIEYPTGESDRVAITRFLNLCIHKLQSKQTVVPELYGNPDMWDELYKKGNS